MDLAWTNFGTGNLDTQEVGDIIDGSLEINKTLAYGEYIGQHNNGNHTQLFQDVNTYLSGLDLPVAVVDASGNFMGWATFHVISARRGTDKHIRGYFVSSFDSARLTVSSCAANACPRYLGLLRPQADRLTADVSSASVRPRSRRPGRHPRRARCRPAEPSVTMTRVAACRARSTSSTCAAIRRSASAGSRPRPARRDRWTAGEQATTQISSTSSA